MQRSKRAAIEETCEEQTDCDFRRLADVAGSYLSPDAVAMVSAGSPGRAPAVGPGTIQRRSNECRLAGLRLTATAQNFTKQAVDAGVASAGGKRRTNLRFHLFERGVNILPAQPDGCCGKQRLRVQRVKRQRHVRMARLKMST